MRLKVVAMLITTLGILVLVVTGCGSSAVNKTTTSTNTISTTIPSTFSGNLRPTPPDGMFSDNMTPLSIDWSAVAEKLNIMEEVLRNAFSNENQVPLDFTTAAEKLEISEQTLREAFGFSWQGPEGPGIGRPGDNSEIRPTNPPTGS